MNYKSNATLSKEAKDSTAAANKLSEVAHDGNTHRAASDAHYEASYKNQQAGNGTAAENHRKIADVHTDKARPDEIAKDFAGQLSLHAERIGQKADKAHFGLDKKDPRSESELHADASDAHAKASKAHELAGDKAAAKYHAAKAGYHRECCGLKAAE